MVIIDDERFYEFRDLTPRDLLWIDHQYESDQEFFTEETFKESLKFLLKAVSRCVIKTNYDLYEEEWSTFVEINKLVQENIMSSRLSWQDFLGFCFVSGNKSFSGISSYMDMSLTNILDMHDVIMEYYEQQKKMMDDAEGRVR